MAQNGGFMGVKKESREEQSSGQGAEPMLMIALAKGAREARKHSFH